jgi:hypothetical protein
MLADRGCWLLRRPAHGVKSFPAGQATSPNVDGDAPGLVFSEHLRRIASTSVSRE